MNERAQEAIELNQSVADAGTKKNAIIKVARTGFLVVNNTLMECFPLATLYIGSSPINVVEKTHLMFGDVLQASQRHLDKFALNSID